MNLAGFAGADLLLGVVLAHQAFGLVDGFDLLLQGDVGLGGLLGASHAARVAIPGDLETPHSPNIRTDPSWMT